MTNLEYMRGDRIVSAEYTGRTPFHGRTVSGYGNRLPTPWRVRYRGNDGRERWYRVRAICYGNASSLYIRVGGTRLFASIAAEARLESARNRYVTNGDGAS